MEIIFQMFLFSASPQVNQENLANDRTSGPAKLLGAGIDRSGFILAVGGGVVCDMAGFLASIYMRGIELRICFNHPALPG